ncbi:hypothetical protein BGW36DRAFT_177599 [Talaromyces proteolyticus]|uniref:Xylanolytic transcriptional activator regulatory domain-containing protein n=1 Tax=Talaromyces proteolyticus TaxID=1131652 RepID=A0AAD4KXA6_9EURO|nr:uncharacterized protein BGW36DRAFT_177599 [Talaromyces proteolyticus]KAH8697989.1 hypothetical protein BGW36DRAFT_177599 [Talaromyces proteolyticus]
MKTVHSRPSPSWGRRLDYMVDIYFCPRIAEQIFHRYTDKYVTACPVVVFPPGIAARHVRKTKPLLFMSILSVASAGFCTLDQQRQFAFEARNFLTDIAIFKGEKSLELIQSLLVVSFWYRAPENYARTNQNQLASLALSIGIDLGLDRIEESKSADRIDDMWNRAEAQRAWLGCFLLCASLSLIMRRPNPIMWTPRFEEYIDNLKQSRLSATDAFLGELLTTEHFCHVADKEMFLSDPSRSVTLLEPNTLSNIEGLQNRVEGLHLSQHNLLEKSLIEFGRLVSSLYAHELALHINHNIDEFKAPFSANSLKSSRFVEAQAPSRVYFSMIQTIIMAAQGLLDTFIGLSTSDMLALPPHIYAGRVIYAVILLMKLHKALSACLGTLGQIISVDQLRLEAYVERLLLISKNLNAEDGGSSLSRAFLIMPQLNEWLRGHISKSTFGLDEASVEQETRSEYCAGPSVPRAANGADIVQSLLAARDEQIQTRPGHSKLVSDLGSQHDHPSLQDRDPVKEVQTFSRELASDSWFWEFFNVDMLH